jgi:tetratricopeptide (TPR) repeat protein
VPGFEPTLHEVLTTGRATVLGRDQLFDLGRLSLAEAVRQVPLEPRYHSTLGELYRFWAEVANEPSYLAPALASFQRAAYLKPNDVEIYAGIADALLLRDDPARAVETAEHARDLLPSYWYPYSILARAYRAMQWDAAAYEAADTALSLASRADLGFKAASPYDLDQLRQIVDATRSAAS